MTSTHALSPIRHQPFSRRRDDRSRFLIAAALFIAVLIADAFVIAFAGTRIADIASLYTTTT
jgi:hypothetical protein